MRLYGLDCIHEAQRTRDVSRFVSLALQPRVGGQGSMLQRSRTALRGHVLSFRWYCAKSMGRDRGSMRQKNRTALRGVKVKNDILYKK